MIALYVYAGASGISTLKIQTAGRGRSDRETKHLQAVGWHRLVLLVGAEIATSPAGSDIKMHSKSRFKRLLNLKREDWALAAEAATYLTAASLAIRQLPFRYVVRSAISAGHSKRKLDDVTHQAIIDSVVWAIEACAKRMPWKIMCFQKGIAAQRLLRRRGIPAMLHYGISSKAEGGGLKAHVWVTSATIPVVGHEVANEYACVATFPPVQAPSLDD